MFWIGYISNLLEMLLATCMSEYNYGYTKEITKSRMALAFFHLQYPPPLEIIPFKILSL